jgi:hypothetical protein
MFSFCGRSSGSPLTADDFRSSAADGRAERVQGQVHPAQARQGPHGADDRDADQGARGPSSPLWTAGAGPGQRPPVDAQGWAWMASGRSASGQPARQGGRIAATRHLDLTTTQGYMHLSPGRARGMDQPARATHDNTTTKALRPASRTSELGDVLEPGRRDGGKGT